MKQQYVVIISSSAGFNPQTARYEIEGFVGMNEKKQLTKVDSLKDAICFHGLNLGRHFRNQIHSIAPENKFIIASVRDGAVQQKCMLV